MCDTQNKQNSQRFISTINIFVFVKVMFSYVQSKVKSVETQLEKDGCYHLRTVFVTRFADDLLTL
jgi:hypothetical protein